MFLGDFIFFYRFLKWLLVSIVVNFKFFWFVEKLKIYVVLGKFLLKSILEIVLIGKGLIL